MSFGVNTVTFDRIKDYNEAVAIEAAIKPIRGRSTIIKPLGARRQDYINIRKETGENGSKIIIRMYRTDIITFHPDNTIEIQPYNSQSTNTVLSDILGVDVFSRQNRQWITCQWETEGETGEKETGEKEIKRGYLPLTTNTLFRRAGAFSYELCVAKPPVFPVAHKINKREMNAVRNRYKGFIDYAVGMLKLRDGVGFNIQEQYEAVKEYREKKIEDGEGQGQKVYIQAWPTTEQQLALIEPDANQTDTGGYYAVLTLLCKMKDRRADVIKGLNNLILSVPALRSRVLIPETKTDGKLVGDRYGWEN